MLEYEDKYPFVPSLLVEFKKRLSEDILSEVNEIIIFTVMYNKKNSDDDNSSDHGNNNSGGGSSSGGKTENMNGYVKDLISESLFMLLSYIVFIPSLRQSTTIFWASSKFTFFSCESFSAKHLLIATSSVNKLSISPVAFTFAFLFSVKANIIPKTYLSFLFYFLNLITLSNAERLCFYV